MKKNLRKALMSQRNEIVRDAFIESLSKIANNDKNIFLITGDLGYGVLDDFAEKFP